MAGTVKEMSLIKQVLQLKQRGESNRGIARQLPINKETVNGYMQTIKANGWKIEDLLQVDDPVLERMFHAGSPAYTDERTEDFLFALRMCLEHLGGVPPIVVPDNLKSAVITPDRHDPGLNKALQDIGNHYGFTVLPCDPGEPTHKALVEDAVRITYNRIARLIKNAGFRQKATIKELEMDTTRGLSTADVTEQATGGYIRDGRFTIVIGPRAQARHSCSVPWARGHAVRATRRSTSP